MSRPVRFTLRVVVDRDLQGVPPGIHADELVRQIGRSVGGSLVECVVMSWEPAERRQGGDRRAKPRLTSREAAPSSS